MMLRQKGVFHVQSILQSSMELNVFRAHKIPITMKHTKTVNIVQEDKSSTLKPINASALKADFGRGFNVFNVSTLNTLILMRLSA